MILCRANLVIRDTEHQDLLPIAFNMREDDRREIWASNQLEPLDALQKGINESDPCLTAELDGRPIAMFGLVPASPTLAAIWFLATPESQDIALNFARVSRLMVERFLRQYQQLQNFVDVRNTKSIEWLGWLGAKFDDPKPYGALQMPFQRFTIMRESNHV